MHCSNGPLMSRSLLMTQLITLIEQHGSVVRYKLDHQLSAGRQYIVHTVVTS